MGFLELGQPLDWENSGEVLEYVRTHGIEQFISTYSKTMSIENDELLWGDEVEYAVFVADKESVRLSLRGAEILKELATKEHSHSHPETTRYERCDWMPEYGSWMVEGAPAHPYSGFANDLLRVENNMRLRRARLLAALAPNEVCPTLTTF